MTILIFKCDNQFRGDDFEYVATSISLLRQVFVLLRECDLQNMFWNADFGINLGKRWYYLIAV